MKAEEAATIAKNVHVKHIMRAIQGSAAQGCFKVSVCDYNLEGGVYQELEEMGYSMYPCIKGKT